MLQRTLMSNMLLWQLIALAGFLASLCLRDFDHYFTDHIPRQIYKKDDAEVDVLNEKALSTLAKHSIRAQHFDNAP